MKNIRKYLFIAFAVVSLLLVSCNADILSRTPGVYDGVGSKPETSEIFNGAAPKNVWASPAYYDDRIIVSFDSVPGADYYEIFKAEAPRTRADVNYEDLKWVKVIYDVSSSNKTRIDYVDSNIDARTSSDKLYYYTVRAGNYATNIENEVDAAFSNPVKGWTINPPTSVEVSQGLSEEYIEIKWSQVDKVKGYRIYYSNNIDADSDVWIPVMDTLLPAPVNQDTLIAKFIPPKELLGKDLYFSIASVSFKSAESKRSGIRNGYTFIPGAPIAPEKANATNGKSAKYIDVSWLIPAKENLPPAEGLHENEKGYFWEVFRQTDNSDPELVCSFNSYANPIPEISDTADLGKNVIWKNKGRYYFRDDKGLQANTEYTYSIRATCYIIDDDSNHTPAIGKASVTKGYIIGPSETITDKKTHFPSGGDNGGFSFTIAEPPRGFVEGESAWNYRIYGRNNVAGTAGPWIQVGSDIPVTAAPVVVNVDYDPAQPVNEFSYTVIDGNGDESMSYFDVYREAIVTERAPAPDVSILSIKSNTYVDGMNASADGVYPVIASVDYSGSMYSSFIIEGLKDEVVSPKTQSAGIVKIGNGEEKVIDKLSPVKVGEKWSYRIQGIDVFGRPSAWSTTVNGYGALTAERYIKFFEAFGLKPWEFVGKGVLGPSLDAKWKQENNSGNAPGYLHWKIAQKNMDSMGNMYVNSACHGGNVHYDSHASGFAGDVNFTYTNFGEIDQIVLNGSYSMLGVSLKGNSDTVRGSIKVGGMYPATVDFSGLTVSGYGFAGNYKIAFDNGLGTVTVKATKN